MDDAGDNRQSPAHVSACPLQCNIFPSYLSIIPGSIWCTPNAPGNNLRRTWCICGRNARSLLSAQGKALSNCSNSLAFESLPLGLDVEDTSDIYFRTYTRTCSFMFYFSSIFMCFPCWCLQPSTFGFGELMDHWLPALGRHDLSASLPFMLAPQCSAWSSDPPCFYTPSQCSPTPTLTTIHEEFICELTSTHFLERSLESSSRTHAVPIYSGGTQKVVAHGDIVYSADSGWHF